MSKAGFTKDSADNAGIQVLQQQRDKAPPSPVKVCFTSKSGAGAWQIRGEQIALTRSNWNVIKKPTKEDIEKYDVFCIVKRADWDFIDHVRKAGKAVVYDIVDAWPKPTTRTGEADALTEMKRAAKQKAFDVLNPWDQGAEDDGSINTPLLAREMFKKLWEPIKADAYIFPTETMRRDVGSIVRHGVTIYHHVYPALGIKTPAETVLTIGHEGNEAYLDEWRPVIEELCAARGIKFVVNPANYTDMDLVLIVRGGAHKTFLISSYKSNVKLVNAYGSGIPALVQADEMSAHDTDEGDVQFFTDKASLERGLDRLINNFPLRQKIHTNYLKAAEKYRIDSIAAQFEALFIDVIKRKKNEVGYESAA